MWDKVTHEDWEIFFKTDEKILNPYHHGHQDFYSFVLYDDGIPVIVDSGGASYDDTNKFSRIVKFAECHNTLLIDNLGYKPKSIKYLPNDYWETNFSYEYKKNDNYVEIRLSCTGFNRIDKSINLSRSIKLSEKTIIIEDHSCSNKTHKITNFFHFSPNIKLVQNDGNILVENVNCNYTFNAPKENTMLINPEDDYKFYSDKYGINNSKLYIMNDSLINKKSSVIHSLEKIS